MPKTYDIYRSVDGGPFVLHATGVTSKEYTDTDVVDGPTYDYEVERVQNHLKSGRSATITATAQPVLSMSGAIENAGQVAAGTLVAPRLLSGAVTNGEQAIGGAVIATYGATGGGQTAAGMMEVLVQVEGGVTNDGQEALGQVNVAVSLSGDLTNGGQTAAGTLDGGITTLHQSTFTAANGTSLDAYTPETGGAWVEDTQDWSIQSNRATGALTSLDAKASTDVGTGEVHVKAVVRWINASATTEHLGVTARGQGGANNNYWAARLQKDTGQIFVYEGITQRASHTLSTGALSLNTDYTIELICTETSITARFNEDPSEVATFSSSTFQTNTRCGLYHRRLSYAACDTFEVFEP